VTAQRRPTQHRPDATTNEKPEDGPRAVEADAGVGDPPGLARLRLDLGYDGARFHGWAAQPGTRTVQGVLSGALAVVLRLPEPPALTVAGRTDAGVHARGQVAHLDVPQPAWAAAGPVALSRLNRLLPADVRVGAIQLAPPGFDARFSALWRQYSYRICDTAGCADPIRRHDTLWHGRPVDHTLMNEAAAACLGEHDFAAFCRRRPTGTTVRALLKLHWHRDETGVLVGTVAADAFCHNMVRSLVGALLAVGDGRKPAAWPAAVLAAAVRDPAVTVASPHPLCLEHVEYPPAGELEARARLTRRVRGAAIGQDSG
jgi:tRNA pseudouridine38-40 synthase